MTNEDLLSFELRELICRYQAAAKNSLQLIAESDEARSKSTALVERLRKEHGYLLQESPAKS
ncbi:MAG TPA: hypothetical protein VHC22_22660 [Pirellulales bacterium]|nr:hypothetical protein [Pirellulales bacterium]